MNYAGAELLAMAEARNYYRWILAQCRAYLGRTILEHGAGMGTFSTLLLEDAGVEKLVALEPATNLVPILRHRLSRWQDRAEIVPSTIGESIPHLRGRGIDTVVSINVLEHIPDDLETLRAMRDLVHDGGCVILFVPALRWLYGSLDVAFEHVRRYGKRELVDKVSRTGFEVETTRFMNLPGVLSWLAVGRLMRRRTLDPVAVRVYDRWVLPILSRAERVCPPPIGQNLLLIARRTSAV
jgi:SAM-dependent methyltransferase